MIKYAYYTGEKIGENKAEGEFVIFKSREEAKSLLTESRKTATEQKLVKCRRWCEGFRSV